MWRHWPITPGSDISFVNLAQYCGWVFAHSLCKLLKCKIKFLYTYHNNEKHFRFEALFAELIILFYFIFFDKIKILKNFKSLWAFVFIIDLHKYKYNKQIKNKKMISSAKSASNLKHFSLLLVPFWDVILKKKQTKKVLC